MVAEGWQSSQELSARDRSGKKDYMTKKWTDENLERKICVYVTDETRKKIFYKTAEDLFNNRKKMGTKIGEQANKMNRFRISVSEIKIMTPETAGRPTAANLVLTAGGIRRPHAAAD